MATGSLAYRRNVAAIQDGKPPEKYLRLLPYITGRRILEIGAAEGVLSLLLADRDEAASVIAVEQSPERHAEALALQRRWWLDLGRRVSRCTMVCGDIRQRYDLFDGVETVVAIRTIYHLREAIPDVFAAMAAAGVSSVVLCGNSNRAKWPNSTPKAAELGEWNRYAGVGGMGEALIAAGYRIDTVVREGDPIVTGRR